MTINVTQAAPPAHLCRLDGTPITPTCTIPVKACGCLAGDLCDCLAPGEFGEFFDRPIHVGMVAR